MGFIIAKVETRDMDDGRYIVETYYKVYYEDEGGNVTYEGEFNTVKEAKEYIENEEWRRV